MFKQCKFVFLCLFLALSVSSQAELDGLEIRHARVNTTIPGMQTTAAYFELVNNTNEAVILESASSDIANRVELHEHKMHEGLMRMRQVQEGISIGAGETIRFEPGGYHIMLMNLEESVKEGATITITLHFADGKTATFAAVAQKASASNNHHSH